MTVFTAENLALDGSLEKFRELYSSVCEIYAKQIGENTIYTLDPTYCESQIKLEICELFSHFFVETKNLYINQETRQIQIQLRNLKYFSFLDKHAIDSFLSLSDMLLGWGRASTDCLPEKYAYFRFRGIRLVQHIAISFENFISQYIKVVSSAIFDEKSHHNSSISPSAIISSVEQNALHYFAKKKESCIININSENTPTNYPLYLYDRLINTGCYQEKHDIVSAKYFALQSQGNNLVILPVHYCKSCKKHLMGRESFDLFESCFGKFILQAKHYLPSSNSSYDMLGESKLHQLGYNVVAGKMSDLERQSLLISILNGKLLSYFEIASTIEQNIRIFDRHPKMLDAVTKWRRDLKFLGEYIVNSPDQTNS